MNSVWYITLREVNDTSGNSCSVRSLLTLFSRWRGDFGDERMSVLREDPFRCGGYNKKPAQGGYCVIAVTSHLT